MSIQPKQPRKNDSRAIPINFTVPPALPAAVRDLADLLADLAILRQKTHPPRPTRPGETS
jgi:hypothetical protein